MLPTPTRVLPLPFVPDSQALEGLFRIPPALFVALGPSCERQVPVPGVSMEDVREAYWRVIDALPDGTEDLVEGEAEELPTAPILIGPDGSIAQLAAVEVRESDLALLAAFADALDCAAGPRPGPQFGPLRQLLDDLGREGYGPWMPQGDAAAVAHWMRNALSLFLHPPFYGPEGEAAYELLTGVLRHFGPGSLVKLDGEEEILVDSVMARMELWAQGLAAA
jgi:hypothetical protein